MPHASSEPVFGPGDGWSLSPTSSCGCGIPAVAASPSAAGPGCISVSHDTTQEGGHNTSVCLRSGPHMHTHTAALSPHLQHAADLHNPVPLLLVRDTQLFGLLPLGRGICYSANTSSRAAFSLSAFCPLRTSTPPPLSSTAPEHEKHQ